MTTYYLSNDVKERKRLFSFPKDIIKAQVENKILVEYQGQRQTFMLSCFVYLNSPSQRIILSILQGLPKGIYKHVMDPFLPRSNTLGIHSF